MRLMTNTRIVVYANCLVSRKRAWNVESDDLDLNPCISSVLFVCDLGKTLVLSALELVHLDN